MRGPQPSYPIELTADESKHLVRAHTTPQALALRARIILTANAHPEQSNQQIALAAGTTDRTVRKWRGRWVATRTLADAPRSGAPRRFSPETRAQVTAIACSLPKQSQVPLSRWLKPNAFVPGAIMHGSIFMILPPSCNKLVRCSKPMPRRRLFCRTACGC